MTAMPILRQLLLHLSLLLLPILGSVHTGTQVVNFYLGRRGSKMQKYPLLALCQVERNKQSELEKQAKLPSLSCRLHVVPFLLAI